MARHKVATKKSELLRIRVSSYARREMQRAARAAGLNLSEWLRSVAQKAANRGNRG